MKVEDLSVRDRQLMGARYREMLARVNKPTHKDHVWYGDRGIVVADEWLPQNGGLQNYIQWMCDQGYKPDCKLEVDRRNNDGPYSPTNCHLVTKRGNNRNSSTVRRNLVVITDADLALIAGCSASNIHTCRKVGRDPVAYMHAKIDAGDRRIKYTDLPELISEAEALEKAICPCCHQPATHIYRSGHYSGLVVGCNNCITKTDISAARFDMI